LLAGAIIPGIIRVVSLAPGETQQFAHEWPLHDQRGRQVPPGRYVVNGELLTDGEPLAASAVIMEIRAR
jgi:hypothetical protein